MKIHRLSNDYAFMAKLNNSKKDVDNKTGETTGAAADTTKTAVTPETEEEAKKESKTRKGKNG